MKIKWIFYGLIAAAVLALNFCGSDNVEEYTTEEVVTPTQGLVTTVKEVESGQFKIEDEQAVDDVTASQIIAKYMDNTIDTFTVEEAKAAVADTSSHPTHQRRSSVMRMASYGLMGYMMGRSMGSYRPNASAYVDQNTYNRVSNSAGQSLNRTATRTQVSRPKSGFGSSRSGSSGSSTRSTRSYGG
ncbi:MAG: hypothetical protein H6573_02175 [Lewinellaceae bacterium]|nr:hypothetical protein [Phaeodactylibacter sp.]MCB9346303.1 hypothetical protein [Lewinellaceae bacterium]